MQARRHQLHTSPWSLARQWYVAVTACRCPVSLAAPHHCRQTLNHQLIVMMLLSRGHTMESFLTTSLLLRLRRPYHPCRLAWTSRRSVPRTKASISALLTTPSEQSSVDRLRYFLLVTSLLHFSINQSIKRFLGGLSSGTTSRSTADNASVARPGKPSFVFFDIRAL